MGRTFVIPDIHGCCRTFRQLLFNTIKLEKTDILYLLGDYIDRGPDSKGVIDTILELQSDGYDVRAIRGNHEQMVIQSIESELVEDLCDWLDNGGRSTLQSYGVEHLEDVPEEHLCFIKALPFFYTTETHIFVHAGLNFCLDNPLSDTSKEFMLWNRITLEVDPKKIGGRKVIAGHTIRHLNEIVEGLGSDFIQLDNGCYKGRGAEGKGNLLALDLASGKLYVQENIDYESEQKE